jgi:hypothetical protein
VAKQIKRITEAGVEALLNFAEGAQKSLSRKNYFWQTTLQGKAQHKARVPFISS